MKKKKAFLIIFTVLLVITVFPAYAKYSPKLTGGLCNQEGVKRTFMILGAFIRIIKIIVPVILLIISSITLFKTSMLGDDGEIKNAAMDVGKKLVIGLLIFFVPEIVDAMVSLVGDKYDSSKSGFSVCWKCFSGEDCSVGGITKPEEEIIEEV